MFAHAVIAFLVGQFETQSQVFQLVVQVPVQARVGTGLESVFPEPVQVQDLPAAGEVVAGGLAHRVPDLVLGMFFVHLQGEVIIVGLQGNAADAGVDGAVIGFQQAGTPGQFVGDPTEVLRLVQRFYDRLAQGPAFRFPVVLEVVPAADAVQLVAFQVGGLRHDDVGKVVALIQGVGKCGGKGELRHHFAHFVRFRMGNGGIAFIEKPDVRRVGFGPAFRGPSLQPQPGQGRGTEQLRAHLVAAHGRQAVMGMAGKGVGVPAFLVGGGEGMGHEPVFPGLHRQRPFPVRIAGHVGGAAQHAAGHLQRAHQHLHHGMRPDALVSAPAVVDGFAQYRHHRTERQFASVHDLGLADMGMGQVFVGDAADGRGRDFGNLRGPFRGLAGQHLPGLFQPGRAFDTVIAPGLIIGADLDCIGYGERPDQGRVRVGLVIRHGAVGIGVPHQRFFRSRVAQVEPVGSHQVGGCGAVFQERHVQLVDGGLVQQYVQHGKQYRVVGLGLDGDPFRSVGAGNRQVRFELYAFHAALARIGMAPHPGHAAGGVDVHAE